MTIFFMILDPEDVGLPSNNNKKPSSQGAERAPLINDATVRLSDLNNPVENRVQGSQTSTFLELLCPVILPNFYSLCVGQVRFSVANVTLMHCLMVWYLEVWGPFISVVFSLTGV